MSNREFIYGTLILKKDFLSSYSKNALIAGIMFYTFCSTKALNIFPFISKSFNEIGLLQVSVI